METLGRGLGIRFRVWGLGGYRHCKSQLLRQAQYPGDGVQAISHRALRHPAEVTWLRV